MDQEKSPAGARTPQPGSEDASRRNDTPPKRLNKQRRILARFVGGESLNRFQAEPLGDHCLHSTVAKLEAKGIRIARQDETVRGFMGCPTHVKRYRLDPDPANVARARDFLAGEHHGGGVPV